jgi:Major tropism determinant N-terminal domain
MAIVQISKIQHRTGANIDLPQLDIGEVGFATDTKQLFIGNDPLIDPPQGLEPTVTEIFTNSANCYIDGSHLTGNINVDIVHATNNGNGTNFKVGDDAWIGDINVSDTMQIKGVANAANGYIVFGNSDTKSLGRSGTGPLTFNGDFTSNGNITATSIHLGTWHIFANVDGIFVTDTSSGNTYSANLTQI